MSKRTSPPRRRAHALLLGAALLSATSPALAVPRCATETDQSVFELEALKTELMVVATTCHMEDRYNAFVERYKPTLAQNGRAFGQYFTRVHGRTGQRQNDIFITELANARSNAARQLGSDFCPRNGGLFTEVMSLRGEADLAPYAAGKDLLSAGVTACEGAPAPRPARPAATRRASR
ncbi:hypothetical protein JYK14_18030 [Siccirubricoccus sp. KC 17139]|uniref:Uncharacterized protein n=1 Tax=Siccirubricoccus soli TaxID=2899147 RepID=A0ABT1D9X1_9PROT|nr:hypothetical protein [Siccirubricoccus soli]MCO6418045.1 hypothetical protein [Siccirubricoccus soli]MCP2684180.1 hypothetical protein [Siccirubricoccus soli]